MFCPTPTVHHWTLASLLLCIVGLLVTPTAAAQQSNQVCEQAVFDTLAAALGLEDWDLSPSNDRILSTACKRWPQQPQFTLATVAYDMGKKDEKELAVAVIDLQSRKVVSLHTETLNEDALTEVGPNSVHIDTARYLLNDQIAAFGVIFTSYARGASCPDAAWADELMLYVPEGPKLRWADELMLYVPEGPKLRAVFSIHLRHLRGLKGSLCQGIDTQVWETASLTIHVANHTSHGWRDLLVKAHIRADTDGNGPALQRSRTEAHTFRYDGHRYRASSKRPWWADSLGH